MSEYTREIWEREELIRFLTAMEWDNLLAAVKASGEKHITMYRKNDMYYFPEQAV